MISLHAPREEATIVDSSRQFFNRETRPRGERKQNVRKRNRGILYTIKVAGLPCEGFLASCAPPRRDPATRCIAPLGVLLLRSALLFYSAAAFCITSRSSQGRARTHREDALLRILRESDRDLFRFIRLHRRMQNS